MLRILGNGVRDCDGVTRRSFLAAGVLGVGGLTLPDLLKIRARAAVTGESMRRSVILFWLSGGPGHMETWDPKPDAPARVSWPVWRDRHQRPREPLSVSSCPNRRRGWIGWRSCGRSTTARATTPRATTGCSPATRDPLSMPPTTRSSAGRRWARRLPGSRERSVRGCPLTSPCPHLRGGTDNLFHYAAYFGGYANPFVVDSDPNDPSFRVKNLKLPGNLSLSRLDDRRRVLAAIDGLRRDADPAIRDLDAYYQRAFEMLTGKEVAGAFDIAAEPPLVRDRYGRHTFGQSALLARRLVEAGVPFVTVNCVPWDHHGTPPQLKTEEGAQKLIPPLDRAIGALIDDLIARGLYESTLVVAMGEFGRTPRMNRDAGRDHWGKTFSVLMGCGSMKMGQVIGRSSARGEYVVDRPISPQDVAATVYHHLGIDGRSIAFADRTGGRPI